MGQNYSCFCGGSRSEIYKIHECDYENTPSFSLENNIYVAKVVDIYDGDTVTCAINIFGKYYKFNVRLSGIDTCEMQSKNREKALEARMRLFDLVTGNKGVVFDRNLPRKNLRDKLKQSKCLVWIRCGPFDKYGRLLGWLYDYEDLEMENSFNNVLVNEKLAYPYFGDKKLADF